MHTNTAQSMKQIGACRNMEGPHGHDGEIRLSAFRDPNFDPEAPLGDDADVAQAYAARDAYFDPDMTLIQWRAQIDALLNKGAPYGKIGCNAATAEKFEMWQRALQTYPPLTPPVQVYRAAHEDVLSFLGW